MYRLIFYVRSLNLDLITTFYPLIEKIYRFFIIFVFVKKKNREFILIKYSFFNQYRI